MTMVVHAAYTKTSNVAGLLPEKNLASSLGAYYRLERGRYAFKSERSVWVNGKKISVFYNEQKPLLMSALFKNLSHKNTFSGPLLSQKIDSLNRSFKLKHCQLKK